MGKTETNPDLHLAGHHRIESTLRAMHDMLAKAGRPDMQLYGSRAERSVEDRRLRH